MSNKFTAQLTKNKILKFLIVFVCSYLTFFILNFNYLKTWSLSGDDLFSLSNSISSPITLINNLLYGFVGQYRHLTYFLFHFYKPLRPHFSAILFTHGIILSLIPTTLFFVLGKHVKGWLRISIIAPFFLTPIFYYHTYTISSLANILMSLLTLIFLYYFENRQKFNSWRYSVLFFLLLLSSIAIKETFIVPMAIFCLVHLLRLRKDKIQSLFFLIFPITIFTLYFLARTDVYSQNIPTDYFFVFDLKHSLNNILDMVAWILNYPRGWQYGSPIRYPIWQPLIALTSLLLVVFSLAIGFIRHKVMTLSYVLFISTSVILFVFLNNAHLFYMDLPFLFLTVLIARAINLLNKKHKKIVWLLALTFFVVNFATFILIKPQWLEYSFVANANKSAKNYRAILEANDYQKYDLICITNHHRGGFGTEDGNLVNHLSKKQFYVISIKDTSLPQECFEDEALRLNNDAWSYQLYDFK